ncbi:DNA polymerase III subunit tau [Pirellula sp. SH-Sr6A]|uniref:DNA polymerase III subunit gamma/tau n=1 Tax=Pirellula sp. SH-Sr6A TaxID=1632865 RepID=UPI00078BAD89|nr:DNA polymerase III subunit gamma/tau [Pirellula sp. SH-Sr6A]AMV34889.1 DNA polymerase III subunit tau [Pirellula sp. SH-Sr6A]
METPLDATTGNQKYTVVARRYRPKTFSELVGQSTVAQALLNAIHTNRVGHAYLFTGARGVGKTSTARIFAKALNASASADGEFDPQSDIAQAIDSGEDMDVIEIDGASNRGIDEIRQLRANAAVRPSRSPYKIYIIDEVHMLTTQAFNALLKTLEEPPGHVKFIFCTTDPEKMPITVLSRCQRFDFPPVHTDQILGRLQYICENEGTEADEAALQIIARRAAGSMRDSQSLLEQLLSFSGNRITVSDVHAMLGTADETRLASFASKMIQRDAAGALDELNVAAGEGVDVGQLAEQLLGYLRDMMVVTVGCGSDLIKTANPSSLEPLRTWGQQWGVASLMAAIQILDETIVKMRHSVQSRVLVEIAIVQICQLQDLQALTDLVKALASGQSLPPPRPPVHTTTALPTPPAGSSKPATPAQPVVPSTGSSQQKPASAAASESTEAKKKDETVTGATLPSRNEPSPGTEKPAALTAAATSPTTATQANDQTAALSVSKEGEPTPKNPSDTNVADTPLHQLRAAAQSIGGLIVECVNMITRVQVADKGKWRAFVAKEGRFAIDYFQTADNSRKLTSSLADQFRVEAVLEFTLTDEVAPHVESKAPAPVVEEFRPSVPQSQLIRKAMTNPIVQQFVEMFDGQIVRVDPAQSIRPVIAQTSTSEPSELIADTDE